MLVRSSRTEKLLRASGKRSSLRPSAQASIIREQRRNENGYCEFLNKKIAVRPDAAPAHAVKTLVHELDHALLHGEDLPKPTAIAGRGRVGRYIVCDALGLDTRDYRFAYVARWSNGATEGIKETGGRSSAAQVGA